MVEQRWGSKEDLQSDTKKSEVKEDEDKKERFEDGPRKSQKEVEERTLSSTFC